MTVPIRLQDSGLQDVRLLARLLQLGTLVLDGNDRPAFANPGACALFGVRDLDALRKRWPSVREELRIAGWPAPVPEGAAYCGRADVTTPEGVRALRFEAHALDGGRAHRVVLLRDRSRLLPADRALLLASEARANRHVLSGLVHAAKGPLNNFHLTLALVAAGAARADASTPEAIARRMRHVDVLQNEVVRLTAYIDEIQALALPHEPARTAIDLAAISRECARVLRHDATIREVRLALDAPTDATMACGDAQRVRLALLSFAICMIELTSRGGRVGWRIARTDAGTSITFDTSEGHLPAAFTGALFRLSCTAESDYSAAIAARLVVEAEGGDVVLHDDSPATILLRFPPHT